MDAMHPLCPHCGSERAPVLWALDSVDAIRRTYRCVACRRTWSVDGKQESLFTDADAPGPLVLEFDL